MYRLTRIVFSLLLLPLGMMAQEGEAPRATVNGFFGGGGAFGGGESAGLLNVGGGAEFRLYKGFTAGAELGYVAPTQGFRDGFGLFSPNVAYHFWTSSSSQKLVPFLTAGYSLGFRNGTEHMANFGGGVDYYITDNFGVRFDVRDHIAPSQDGDPTVHFPIFRFGVVVR